MASFDYDEYADSLFVSSKKPSQKVQGSAEIGDIVIDFTSEGKIVSMEIRGISQILKMIGVKSDILKKLEAAKLVIVTRGNAIMPVIVMKTKTVEQKVPLAYIPMRKPLIAN